MNMTHSLKVDSSLSPLALHRLLRQVNPSPYGGYIRLGKTEAICASPEQFMQVRRGQVQTKPIKGTRPRGASPEADLLNAKELGSSEKERAELLMIVDLERNDLNRVCEPGSVQVTQHYQVETHPTVFQLVSTITGKLAPQRSAIDLLRCSFPGGSITGAPKQRAMEIIDTVERTPRGLYTGSMLYIGFNGEMDSNIVIRTALATKTGYEIGVGGGITYESIPRNEYEETLQKGRALVEAIKSMEVRHEN